MWCMDRIIKLSRTIIETKKALIFIFAFRFGEYTQGKENNENEKQKLRKSDIEV